MLDITKEETAYTEAHVAYNAHLKLFTTHERNYLLTLIGHFFSLFPGLKEISWSQGGESEYDDNDYYTTSASAESEDIVLNGYRDDEVNDEEPDAIAKEVFEYIANKLVPISYEALGADYTGEYETFTANQVTFIRKP